MFLALCHGDSSLHALVPDGVWVPLDYHLTRIRLHLPIYFLLLRGESDSKVARSELCRIIRHLRSGIVRGILAIYQRGSGQAD